MPILQLTYFTQIPQTKEVTLIPLIKNLRISADQSA